MSLDIKKIVKENIKNAYEHKEKAEANSSADYKYWDGYIDALQSIYICLPD
jgi:hypothetical protein